MRKLLGVGGTLTLLLMMTSPALANHQWGNLHWKRTSDGQVNIKLLDSTTSYWRNNITGVVRSDWDQSNRHDVSRSEVANDADTRRNCPMPNRYRRIRMCNYEYGAPAWSGLATVAANPHTGHIMYATAKMDIAGSENNTDSLRKHTTCQEVGHGLGLDHRSGDTCMGQGSNPHPDSHDIDFLQQITHKHSAGVASSDPSWLDDVIDVDADPCIDSLGNNICTIVTSHSHGSHLVITKLKYLNLRSVIDQLGNVGIL